MRIVALNCAISSGGGKVMLDIARVARKNNYDYYTFSPQANIETPQHHYYFSTTYEHRLNVKIGKLTGYDNAFINYGSKEFINKLKELNPDIIHLHGLHNWSIDYKILTDFIKKSEIPTVWTQHDCWSFTGKCPYYTIINCDKWKNGCYDCPQLLEYPQSKIIDNSTLMYNYKKKCFLNIPNLTLVTVSNWLQSQLKQSFLKDYHSVVIENGIDTERFRYKKSKLRECHDLGNKFIILAVASGWSKRKGLEDVINLANLLKREKMNDCKIVLIGATDDQVQICKQHDILSFNRTQNIEELVEWYSIADVFFNPSMEETFGLVTAEAMSCGTPVIVYDSTASPEIVDNTDCYCLKPHNLDDVLSSINEIKFNGKEYYKSKCIQKVKNSYNSNQQYLKYLDLYEQIFR